MAVRARLEIVVVVAGGVAPLDVRFGLCLDLRCIRRDSVGPVAARAFRDGRRFFRGMRHIDVGVDLLSARRSVGGGGAGKPLVRSVALEADLFGDGRPARLSRLGKDGQGAGLQT